MERIPRTPLLNGCARIRAAVVAALFFAGTLATDRAQAGCGSYIHFRGRPEMQANPVAQLVRLQQVRLQRTLSQSPAEEGDPAGECHGPACSRQRAPVLPLTVRLLLHSLPDCLAPLPVPELAAGESAPLVVAFHGVPSYSVGSIFRPPCVTAGL